MLILELLIQFLDCNAGFDPVPEETDTSIFVVIEYR